MAAHLSVPMPTEGPAGPAPLGRRASPALLLVQMVLWAAVAVLPEMATVFKRAKMLLLRRHTSCALCVRPPSTVHNGLPCDTLPGPRRPTRNVRTTQRLLGQALLLWAHAAVPRAV